MKEFIKKQYDEYLNTESIDSNLYEKYNVKRGLRNNNGTGVLVGLTRVAEVSGYYMDGNVKMPKMGNLYYRGIDISEVVNKNGGDFDYENTCFLLLFGHYPNKEEERKFRNILSEKYVLPDDFINNIILKNPSKSLMNHISRSILSLYSFDDNPDDISGVSLLEKGISIIAKMPAIIAYSLQAKDYYLNEKPLYLRKPKKEYSLAENILYLSREDGKFDSIEAKILDMALVVHADHGGGNNSTFVGTVVASTLTDIYSMISASMSSLKGPRHGGANMAVLDMMTKIIEDVGLDATDEQLKDIMTKILNKEYFDKKGLIYGIGHAIYTISDPRCVLLKKEALKLAKEKNNKKFEFYARFEKLATEALENKTKVKCCANVDFYSGLIYEMLSIPRDLFVPIFATARLVGWVSHNIESILFSNKIVRPATKYVGKNMEE